MTNEDTPQRKIDIGSCTSCCIHSLHCYAHVLNLVLVDTIKSIPILYTFRSIYVFISNSKAHVVFVEKQTRIHPDKQLQKLSDTMWVCRYAAVNAECRT